MNKRKGIGIELKESYFKQAQKNMENIKYDHDVELFDDITNEEEISDDQ